MDSVYSDVIERLQKDYHIELLMNADLDEKQRLEIIYKRELLDEIVNMVKGYSGVTKRKI